MSRRSLCQSFPRDKLCPCPVVDIVMQCAQAIVMQRIMQVVSVSEVDIVQDSEASDKISLISLACQISNNLSFD